jgi:hypothetical protein
VLGQTGGRGLAALFNFSQTNSLQRCLVFRPAVGLKALRQSRCV